MSWPFPKSLGNSWQPSGVNRVSSQTRFEQLRLLICISKDSETSCCYHNSAQKMGDARCPHELRSGGIRDMFCVKRNPCRMQLWSTLLPFLGTGKIWFLDFEVQSHIILDGSVSFILGTSWNTVLQLRRACVKECFAKNWTKHSQVHEAFRSRQRGGFNGKCTPRWFQLSTMCFSFFGRWSNLTSIDILQVSWNYQLDSSLE